MKKPQRFMARQDPASLEALNRIFNRQDRYVYFIERQNEHDWLIEYQSYTTDPLKATAIKNIADAQLTINLLRIGKDHIVTEHEFIELSLPSS